VYSGLVFASPRCQVHMSGSEAVMLFASVVHNLVGALMHESAPRVYI